MILKPHFRVAYENKINIQKHYLIIFINYMNLSPGEGLPIIAISAHLNIGYGYALKLIYEFLQSTDDYEYMVINDIPALVRV